MYISPENILPQKIIGSIAAVLLLLGIIFETVVIASILRVRQKPVDTLFILALCIVDLLFNLLMFPLLVFNIMAEGWASGQFGCQVAAFFAISAIGISIISITFITLNRYLIIMKQIYISKSQCLWMIAGAYLCMTIFILVYSSNKSLVENSIALQPSLSYCLLDFASIDPIVFTVLITNAVFLSVPVIFMTIAYYQIIAFYRNMNRKKKRAKVEVK